MQKKKKAFLLWQNEPRKWQKSIVDQDFGRGGCKHRTSSPCKGKIIPCQKSAMMVLNIVTSESAPCSGPYRRHLSCKGLAVLHTWQIRYSAWLIHSTWMKPNCAFYSTIRPVEIFGSIRKWQCGAGFYGVPIRCCCVFPSLLLCCLIRWLESILKPLLVVLTEKSMSTALLFTATSKNDSIDCQKQELLGSRTPYPRESRLIDPPSRKGSFELRYNPLIRHRKTLRVYCVQRRKKPINLLNKTSNKWQWSWLQSPTTVCSGEKQQGSKWNLCNSNLHETFHDCKVSLRNCRCPATHWYFCHLVNSVSPSDKSGPALLKPSQKNPGVDGDPKWWTPNAAQRDYYPLVSLNKAGY